MSHYLQVIINTEECDFSDTSIHSLMNVLAGIAAQCFNGLLDKPKRLERYNEKDFRYVCLAEKYKSLFVQMNQFRDEEQLGITFVVMKTGDSVFAIDMAESVAQSHDIVGNTTFLLEEPVATLCKVPSTTIVQYWSFFPNDRWVTNISKLLDKFYKPSLAITNTGAT